MPSINTAASSRFVTIETSAKMPNSVKAAYKHCAVLEIDADYTGPIHGISDRYKGIRGVVWQSGNYPAAGKTARSERQSSLAYAAELAAERNSATKS